MSDVPVFTKPVCLFDIDGTLLRSGGAGQHAMELALEDTFGVCGPYENISAAGRTDRAITTDLFNHHGIDLTEAALERFTKAYLSHLPTSLSTRGGCVLPGVIQLLEGLSERGAALGLLTGNFQVSAQVKLKHFQIEHYFDFGGYGDHHHERDDVARWALKEACTFLQRDVPAHATWVIGDTPSDIRCARAIGARVIAVATGVFPFGELEREEPDFLLDSLADVTMVLNLIDE